MNGVSIVVPTLGRPSLGELLTALGPVPELLIVDDRPRRDTPLRLPAGITAEVLPGRAAGPAAARNIGWRAARTEWVAFLDDDVLPDPGWFAALRADLDAAPPQVGGVQGNLRVPLPPGRRPTDWERVTAGLADGEWITADMAYRRAALQRAGGFDERLPRAFREDAELAHRVRQLGFDLRRGQRWVTHPVRPESRWVSVRTQRGNADDALLRRMYGPNWRTVLGVPPGRRRRHAAVTAAGAAALGLGLTGLLSGRRQWTGAAALAAAGWAAGTAEFAAARIGPGPRDRRELTTMLLTSAAIPPVAVAHWLRGWRRWRGATPLSETPAGSQGPLPAAESRLTASRKLAAGAEDPLPAAESPLTASQFVAGSQGPLPAAESPLTASRKLAAGAEDPLPSNESLLTASRQPAAGAEGALPGAESPLGAGRGSAEARR